MHAIEIHSHPDFDNHEVVEIIETDGLKAIIAVHNSNLGPAVGGCRMFPYADQYSALTDVLRLSRGMTYKSALAGLPLGGGKSVIIGNPSTDKTRELLLEMGEQIDRLQGRYITAEDSGTGVEDMAIIAEKTAFVSGVLPEERFGGDPSPRTALGVFLGIQAAVNHRYNSDLAGLRVAVQGAGHVGRHLIRLLIAAGARVSAADVSERNLELAAELGAEVVPTDQIKSLECDVFAPCAMGGVIDRDSLNTIRAGIIAGAANNQLAEASLDQALFDRGVLYVPDYVLNAGGIIDVFYQRAGERDDQIIEKHIGRTVTTLGEIFSLSEAKGKGTGQIADEMAEAIFTKGLKDVA